MNNKDQSQLTCYLVPETLNGTLEDISAFFEESGGAWLIGPGSRKRLAQIIANREATEAEIAEGEKENTGGTMETIENIENIKAEI